MQLSIALLVNDLTNGVNVSPVVESVIIPGQECLIDADKNNVKVNVKSYSFSELNCDWLHILITFN